MHPVTSPSPADTCVRSCIALSDVFARLVAMEHHSHHSRLLIPVCGAYGGLYPNLSRINFLGPSFFRNKCPFPKKGTTPRRTCYTKNIQNQFWDHGGKHLWIKFQWPRSCLSLCKSPTNSAPRNSTLFFGCKPSVAEYFSMGQPP